MNTRLPLPDLFIQRMKSQLGDEAEDFFNALSQPAPTSIRLHHRKGRCAFDAKEKIPWCETGYYLETRPLFQLDPHWHAGAYYVQEASSMILDYVVALLPSVGHPRIWLDLCAAPGGKSGILAKHLGPGDVLLANEVVPQRRSILFENLVKSGCLNTFISGMPISAFHEPLADIILIDAPCAGEGMMRKDPEAVAQWTPSLVQSCSALQKRIIQDAVRSLNPGGHVIYSTCSYSMDENILNVLHTMETFHLEPVSFSFPSGWGITELSQNGAKGYQLYPHKVKGEGLFFAVLKNNQPPESTYRKSKKPVSIFEPLPAWLADHLEAPSTLLSRRKSKRNEIIMLQAEGTATQVALQLPQAELIPAAGELKGRDFIPSHAMAMAGLPNAHYPTMDLELYPALDYLERNTGSLPGGLPPGWYLIRYQGSVLGWAKNTAQGWKNHYPINWRLRDRNKK